MQVKGISIQNTTLQNRKDVKKQNPSFGMALRQFSVEENLYKDIEATGLIHKVATKVKRVANGLFSGAKKYTDTFVTVDGNIIKADVKASKLSIDMINTAKHPVVDKQHVSEDFMKQVTGRYDDINESKRFIKNLNKASKQVISDLDSQLTTYQNHTNQVNALKDGKLLTKEMDEIIQK